MATDSNVFRRILDVPTAFFAARVTGSSAAAARIVFGALAAWNAFTLLLNTERFFSEAGAFPWAVASADKTWGAFASAPLDIDHTYSVLLAYIFISLLMMVGVASRVSCAAVWYLHLSVIHRSPVLVSGADYIFGMLLFISIFLPLGRRWSVDAWVMGRLTGRWPALFDRLKLPLPSIWSTRLFQLQVSLIYFITALQKAQYDVWLKGEAVRGFLAMPSYSTWPMWHDHWPFMKPLTWGTLAFEFAFPLLIWFRPFRRWLLLAGIALHVGIDILMQVPMFSAVMICSYVMFVPDDVAERWMNQLEARLRRAVERAKPVP